ncbi:PorP/SprF family type IX secretion system membrane protein [Myroides pelagicus]|uniref:Type IX secretion system membrane protein PorP/SprF n=1 Tax=Myroides pelagicus TaxID=270914 RepID=A0A7K1GPR3_9FLAO|nr:type IX secretion system membrane protein PorP/SprF [Myroides pelagicus]MTH30895.1 type IX secretion system membrane protein PorP/SprF [Myroides pelagicus]
MKRYNSLKKWSVCALIGLGVSFGVYAQQDPQYTQYMYNHANINPAYSGSLQTLSIYGQYRTQWVGLEGSPKTANFSVTSPIGETGLGVGVHFKNDQLGAMIDNTFSIDVSYSVYLNHDYQLAFGIKGSGNLLDVDYSRLHVFNTTDPVTQKNIDNSFTPNIGTGVFLYSDKAYVGFSIPNLLTTTRYDDNVVSTMKQKMHYYLTAGYVFDIHESVKLKPALLVKAVQGAPLQADVSLNTLVKEKLTLGVAYRWDASLSALAGFQVAKGLFVGYAYDMDTTELARYNNGSHEVFLKFDLFNKLKRTHTPRFF